MTCPYCGAATTASARFCSTCGRALTSAAPLPATGAAARPEQPTTRLAAPPPPAYSPPPLYQPAPLAPGLVTPGLDTPRFYQGGPARDPSVALVLEIVLGVFGFLGVGHLYAGRTNLGIALLLGWWAFLF